MITPLPPSSDSLDAQRRDLHPVLSAAIDCLDFDLEEELARYQRMTQPIASPRALGQATPLDALAPDTARLSTAQPDAAQPDTAQSGAAHLDGTNPKTHSQQNTAAIAPAAVTLLTDDESLALVTTDALAGEDYSSVEAPEAYLESSEELLKSLDDFEDLPEDNAPRWRLSGVFTPLTVGLMLLVGLSSLTLTYVFFQARSVQVARQAPDEAALQEGDRSPLSPLSPNLTVGEFAKLDLSRLIGLPMFKPARTARPNSTLTDELGPEAGDGDDPSPNLDSSALDATIPQSPSERVPESIPESVPERPLEPPARPAPAIAPQPAGPAPALPVEPIAPAPPTVVNTPRTARSAAGSRETSSASEAPASEAPTSEAPTSEASAPKPPAPQPTAARVRPPLPAAGSDLRNSPQRSAAPASAAPPATPPAPAAQPSNSAPPAGPSSNAEGSFHHVVTPYTGDRSLQEAREAVSGAYVRNASGSAQVQLGAFESESQAEQFVDELAEQGIDATIQP